jgi:hypothetical protein
MCVKRKDYAGEIPDGESEGREAGEEVMIRSTDG